MLSRRPPPPIPVTPLPSGQPGRLDYARPGESPAWGEREQRRLRRILTVILATPIAAIVYFHAGVAWGRRREGLDVLFKPATGTDFYEIWLCRIPVYAVTIVLGIVALGAVGAVVSKRWAQVWLVIPAVCVAVWVAFNLYLAIAADGPFP